MVRVFRIRGVMKHRMGFRQRFTVEVTALKPEHAVEQVYSELGSRHKLKRRQIIIESVEEVPPDQVSRPEVRALLDLDRIVVV